MGWVLSQIELGLGSARSVSIANTGPGLEVIPDLLDDSQRDTDISDEPERRPIDFSYHTDFFQSYGP
jgi:hypothetical protein